MKISPILPLALIAVILSAASYGQTNKTMKDYLSMPGPIVFDKKSYNLTWSSHPSATYYKHEYITAGDNVDKFKSMIVVDVLTGDLKLKDIVAAKIAELKKMKETNPVINYEMFDNSKTGEYMIDFLLTANAADGKISIAERNVYRYKTFTDKSGQTGIILFGVSTRSYGDDVTAFLTALKTNKSDLVNKVAAYKIEEVKIKK